MGEAGLEDIETYIPRRKNTVAQYIVTRPIFDMSLEAALRTGEQVRRR